MQLYKHQLDAVEKAKHGNLCLFHDCGTGKTITAINIIRHWINHYKPAKIRTLVLCPLTIINNAWAKDLLLYPELDAVNLWDKSKQRRMEKLREEHDIYIVNFEQFRNMAKEIASRGFTIVIVDESSKMKNPKSLTTKAIIGLAGFGDLKHRQRPIPHRYCMSGTPAPNDESEYWAQVSFINPRIFGNSFWAFRSQYFYKIPLGGLLCKWEFRRNLKSEFMDRMKPVIDVAIKREVVDLPDIVFSDWHIELTKEERNCYEEMKKTLVLELSGQTITAEFALTKIQKLRQLACGFIYDANGNVLLSDKTSSKIAALREILDHLEGRQVVIWAVYDHVMRMVKDLLGSRAVLLQGSQKQKDEAIDLFLARKAQYIVANPASGGHGLNFQYNASEAVYITPDYSFEYTSQSQNRIDRLGQTSKVTIYRIIAEDTWDTIINQNITSKKELHCKTMEYLNGKSIRKKIAI